MKKRILVLSLGAILFVVGCVKTYDSAGKPTVALDPNAGIKIQQGLDVATTATTGAGLFWPGMTGVGLILGWASGLWRKLNPVLSATATKTQKYYDVTNAIVSGIESFKDACPAEWEKLSAQLEKVIGPEAENVIRALRNLPPIT
jgi:hypothetical protein